MIDQLALQKAYASDGIYALQLEVGDRCFQDCVYCYMNALPQQQNTLSDELIVAILEAARALGISAIEWLGGEPLLRESITELLAAARELGLRNNIWTGGLPLTDPHLRQQVAELARHGLVAVHVSTVDPQLYEMLHPHRGADDLAAILMAVRGLLDLGYPAAQMLNSITLTGLQSATDALATIDHFATEFGIKACVNVYHTYQRPGTPAGDLARFIPEPDLVATVYAHLADQWQVDELPMNCVNKHYCSATIAILCDGRVTPCATIREVDAPSLHDQLSLQDIVAQHRDHLIFKRFKDPRRQPASCRDCDLSAHCWGCRSRAYAANLGMYGKDPRCFRHPAAR